MFEWSFNQPWQTIVQSAVSFDLPTHGDPLTGIGFVQDLVLVRVPFPHSLLHSLHLDQDDQPPFSETQGPGSNPTLDSKLLIFLNANFSQKSLFLFLFSNNSFCQFDDFSVSKFARSNTFKVLSKTSV